MKTFEGQKGKQLNEAEYLTYTHKFCPECAHVKTVLSFYKKKTRTKRGWAWDTYCIDCRKTAYREYGVLNRAKRNARLRRWRHDNPLTAKENDRRKRLRYKYGISEDDLKKLEISQKGKCAICGQTTKRLCIDHSHKSGKARGMLCQTCNTFLGWYENKAGIIIEFQRYLDATN